MRFLSTLIASTLGTLLALGIILFFGTIFLVALISATDRTPQVRTGSVLVVELKGAIPEVVSGDPLMQAIAKEPGYDLRSFVAAIDMAAADDRIDGIWLQVRSVPVAWASLEEVRHALLRFKETGKPIFASSDDFTMTETEYFLASVADSVFAAEQAMFVFNGFYVTFQFVRNLLDNLEIEPTIIRTGEYKSAVEPFTRDDLSPENEEQIQAILNAVNDVFLGAVSQSRDISVDVLHALATQDVILTASQAYDAGLLDALLFEDQVVDVIKERMGVAQDDDLRTVSLRSYVRISPSDAGLRVNREGDIAIVYADGGIVSGESERANPLMGLTVGSQTLKRALREVRESDNVKAVVVHINSPGGSASASDEIWRAIRLTADVKPVVVSMGPVAASGGYWIASAAETIVADPLTITGSIGVFALLLNVNDFFENKLGVTFDNVRTSPYADLFSGVRSPSEEEHALLTVWIDRTYDDFLDRVAESRTLDRDEVDEIARGRVWTGVDALQVGLVDTLGTLKTAVELAARKAEMGEGPYRVRVLPRPKTFLEQLSEGLSARAVDGWLRLARSPAERAMLDQARTIHSALREHGRIQARMPFDVVIR